MRVFSAAFAIASGLIVLLGYFFPIPPLRQLRLILTDWAIVIAGFSVLIGMFNLVAVQMEKIRARQKGSAYGALLVISLILTFGIGFLLGPEDTFMKLAVDAVIVPVEASLMAILSVTLIFASIRLLRRRVDVSTVLFLLVAVLFLLAVMPKPFSFEAPDQIIIDVAGMFSRGGVRGLLIGISLGTLLTGLRVLLGVDRPYGGN